MKVQISESVLDLLVTKYAPPIHPAFKEDDGYEELAQAIADYCASLFNAHIHSLETSVYDLQVANAAIALDKNKAMEANKKLTAELAAAREDVERVRAAERERWREAVKKLGALRPFLAGWRDSEPCRRNEMQATVQQWIDGIGDLHSLYDLES